MPEVERTPHTDILVRVRGDKIERVVSILREHGIDSEIVEDDDEIKDDFFVTNLYRQTEAETTGGERLGSQRRRAKMTQAALGEAAGFTPRRISDMECGRRGISIAAARKLAAALGVTAGEIVAV
ncbi:MAG: helix-turn-helix domain-containing protein [Desulfobulbus sp.]|nr:helix-turn-helix domain-containing protein [Desulfobulbus sp.]